MVHQVRCSRATKLSELEYDAKSKIVIVLDDEFAQLGSRPRARRPCGRIFLGVRG